MIFYPYAIWVTQFVIYINEFYQEFSIKTALRYAKKAIVMYRNCMDETFIPRKKDMCSSSAEEQMTVQCCSCAETRLRCTGIWVRYEVQLEVARHRCWAVLYPVAKRRSSGCSTDTSATAIGFPWRLGSTILIDYGKYLQRRSLAGFDEA